LGREIGVKVMFTLFILGKISFWCGMMYILYHYLSLHLKHLYSKKKINMIEEWLPILYFVLEIAFGLYLALLLNEMKM
jgi:hypothetical protein